MLIDSGTSFKKGDVITIKNILGEEIMCTFVKEDSTHYIITDPWALGMSQEGMTLMPPVVSSEMKGELKFAKIHAMWAIASNDQFIPGYTKQVTGIEIVTTSKKIII